jgi:hypothetical protein
VKSLPSFYPVRELSLSRSGEEKVALLRRVDAAARAYDPRIVRVEAGYAEGWSDVLVVSSDGTMARDRQPMVRLGVNAMAEEQGKRQSGRSGTAKRRGLDLFAEPGSTPEDHGREAARLAIAMLHAQEAPAGPMEVVLAAGESGILLHEAVGHGLEADFNRKQTSNYSGQMGKQVASSLCTVVDDATITGARGSINVDDEGIPGGRNVLIENGILVGYMQDRISARHFGTKPTGNGRRESFRQPPMPRMTNTLLARGQRRSAGHHRFGRPRRLCQALLGRPGEHLERRLRLFADRELPHRGRQADRAPAWREPHRQRSRGAAQRDHGGARFPAFRWHLDLRQGRPVGSRRHRHAHGQDRADHGGRHEGGMSASKASAGREPKFARNSPSRCSASPARGRGRGRGSGP